MLAEGRTIAEVLETSRRFFKPGDSMTERHNAYILTLCALKGIPGEYLSDEDRLALRRIGAEVVRGVPA